MFSYFNRSLKFFVFFFCVLLLVALCFFCVRRTHHEPQSGSKSENNIFAFQLQGKSIPPLTYFTITYSSPYKWRCEERLEDICTKISLCNGKFAWAYTVENSQIKDIAKWNIEIAAEKYGTIITQECLMLGGSRMVVYALGDPKQPRWKDEFSFPIYNIMFNRIGEEIIDEIPCLYYDVGDELKYRLWFGKKDGLIRKETLFDRDSVFQVITVEKVSHNPIINEKFFDFEPHADYRVTDHTNDLIKDIEKRLRIYKAQADREKKIE